MDGYLNVVKSRIPFGRAVKKMLYIADWEDDGDKKKKVRGCKRAPCPFCGLPMSLLVNEDKQCAWCEDCERGGDIFSIACAAKRMSIKEAAESLAKEYNITLMNTHTQDCRNR